MAKALAGDTSLPWEKRRSLLMGAESPDYKPSPQDQRANREMALSLAPVTGEAMSLRDALEASGQGAEALMGGDIGGAASGYGEMALGLLGALPGIGMVARAPRAYRRAMDIEVYPGKPVKVLQDPSPDEAREFVEATPHKAARVLDDPDTGARYIWPAEASAMHGQIAQKLGVKFDPSGPEAGKILTPD